MKTSEIAAVLDELKQELSPLDRRGRGQRRSTTRSCRRLPDRPAARADASSWSTSAATTSTGGSTRPRTRSRTRSGTTDIRHHDALRRRRPRVALRDACTSSATASTSARSTRRSSGRRSAAASSLGLHESQSRMWENLVGRSLPFWRCFYPRLQESFPAQLGGVDAGGLLPRREQGRAVAHPGRGRRGHLQHAHHPALRARAGDRRRRRRARATCPEAWNEQMKEYLGIDVPDDARGVLQDVHWAGGGDRLLPDLLARQRDRAPDLGGMRRAIPDLDEQFEQGEFGTAARVAPRQPPPLRAQVHAAGDARSEWPVPHSTSAPTSAT